MLLGVTAQVCASAAPVSAQPEVPGPPHAGGPYLGAILDWSRDSPAGYRKRLGLTAAVYGYTAPVPMGDDDVTNLRVALLAAARQGAGLEVTVLPTVPLDDLTERVTDDLVTDLSSAGVGGDVPVWLRPLPEMNAPWQPWGQQPGVFRRVFTRIADATHARLPRTAMVWQPAYGAGYPFSTKAAASSLDAGPTEDRALDTDGDGRLTYRDDPYGPYWPGPGAVDWVGLSLYHWGAKYPFGFNQRPSPGKLLEQLAGRYGYPDDRQSAQRDFYQRFVEDTGRPMVLESAALYSPAGSGETESAVKQAWWDQLSDPVLRARYPDIGMVLWLEVRRPEDEALGRVVDWRATHAPGLAAGFRRTTQTAHLTLGRSRAYRVEAAPAAARPSEASGGGSVLRGSAAVTVVILVGTVVLALLALGASPRRRRWVYLDDGSPRDLRIDLLRGIAICFVVVDHVNIPSLWQQLTQEAIGPVSGAELFVALSGVVLGLVYGPRVTDRQQWYDAAGKMWKRAVKLWLTALAVIFLVYLVAVLPGVNARILTTFTDQGTGTAGGGASGRVYELYAGFANLTDYPVPASTLRDILLLQMGPSQINILGLYVVLLLVAPLMAWLLARRWWAPLVVASLALYAVNTVHPLRVLPSQFEDPFPLLSWQVLFVLGLVAGWHRTALVARAATPVGRLLVTAAVLASTALMLFSWSNPYLSNRFDVRLALLPDADFRSAYAAWFSRAPLAPGRVLAVVCVVVTAYALLTRFWVPLERALGWFLVPLGQATLYVFLMHVLCVVAVANLPVLTSNVWLGTLTHAVILAVLWLMVRRRFLFRLVPR